MLHGVSLDRLASTQPMAMPPPATPASAIARRHTPTTASGLDMRESMTPFVTPSRPLHGKQTPLQKRVREEEVDEFVPGTSCTCSSCHGGLSLDACQTGATPNVLDAS